MSRAERKQKAKERREETISGWSLEVRRHIDQFSPTFNKGFDVIENIYNREVRKTPQLKTELETVRGEVSLWYATTYSEVLEHEAQLDLLNADQIQNWRRFLLTLIGPWAMLMPDADVQRFRDIFQVNISK